VLDNVGLLVLAITPLVVVNSVELEDVDELDAVDGLVVVETIDDVVLGAVEENAVLAAKAKSVKGIMNDVLSGVFSGVVGFVTVVEAAGADVIVLLAELVDVGTTVFFERYCRGAVKSIDFEARFVFLGAVGCPVVDTAVEEDEDELLFMLGVVSAAGIFWNGSVVTGFREFHSFGVLFRSSCVFSPLNSPDNFPFSDGVGVDIVFAGDLGF